MKLAAKLALGAGVVAVGVCGVLAFIAADDERRDFVQGSTRSTALPTDVLVVDAECVDDEYEDTDDEAERVAQVAPTMTRHEGAVFLAPKAKTKLPGGPETENDETQRRSDTPVRNAFVHQSVAANNNRAVEICA